MGWLISLYKFLITPLAPGSGQDFKIDHMDNNIRESTSKNGAWQKKICFLLKVED